MDFRDLLFQAAGLAHGGHRGTAFLSLRKRVPADFGRRLLMKLASQFLAAGKSGRGFFTRCSFGSSRRHCPGGGALGRG